MNRISVITGASAGIGAAAALELARRGDRVVIIGRTPAKVEAVAQRIADETDTRPSAHVADFADLSQVRKVAAVLRDEHERIDVLANNAGLMSFSRVTTDDGHELTVQVNHLGGFLLTNLLLDRLGTGSRVITTTSGIASIGRADPTDLSMAGSRFNKWRAYANSKKCNILFTVELARRLKAAGVSATCFHPGFTATDFTPGKLLMTVGRPFTFLIGTAEEGASTLVHLATHDDGLTHSGRFFKKSKPARMPRSCGDLEHARQVWEASAAAVGLPDPAPRTN